MSTPAGPSFLGRSEAFQVFLAELRQVAASDATVLIAGQTGTGKTTAASWLHHVSPRAQGPLVVVSLAALTPNLVESELFGHVRGAFTGAHRDRAGCFKRAHGGTLVLDDVALLPLEAQVKLLRVLQERVVEPLGGEGSEPVDVRLVSTTSRGLASRVQAGSFREDLFYRISVVPVEVPPLRVRAGDLAPLSEHFLEVLAGRLGVASRPLSPAALARLEAHAWPGNVRELENALSRVLALAPARDPEAASDGPAPIAPEEFEFLGHAVAGVAYRLALEALSHGLEIEEVTNAMMDRALEEQRGNVSAAARQLGLTRRALEYRKLRKVEEA